MSESASTAKDPKLASLQRCHAIGCILWVGWFTCGQLYGFFFYSFETDLISTLLAGTFLLLPILPLSLWRLPRTYLKATIIVSALICLIFVGFFTWMSTLPGPHYSYRFHPEHALTALVHGCIGALLIVPWPIVYIRSFSMVLKKNEVKEG